MSDNNKQKNSSFPLTFFVCLFIMLAFASCSNSSNDDNEFEDVFNKNPNTWTDKEKDHVNSLFEWMDKNN